MTEFTESDRRTLLAACCLAAFITPLMSTMMNLSLTGLGEYFGEGSHNLGYVNSSYLLASAVFLVPFAKIGDIIGKRRVFLIGNAIIAVASVIGMLAPDFWTVVVSRALIGVGSAAVVCMSLSMITDVYPPGMRGMALGMNTTCVYIGLAIGPVVGGILNDSLGWQSLFAIVVPMSVGAILLMLRFRHEIRPDAGGSLDYKGSVLYASAILLAMGGMISLPEVWAVACVVVGVVLVAFFAYSQSRSPNPVLDVGLFRNRMFAGSCISAFISYAASYCLAFFMALYLQNLMGFSAMYAGLIMLAQSLVQVVFTIYFGRMSDRMADPRTLPVIGMAIITVGLSTLVFYTVDTPLWMVIVTLVLVGFGFSVFSTPNTSAIMSSVPREMTAEASAMVSVMRQTGMLVSMGVAMTLIAVIMGSADNLAVGNHEEFIQVVRTAFSICTVLGIAGIVLSMMGRRKHTEG